MAEQDRREAEVWPRCDCGYTCQGASQGERLVDGQRHAAEVHGIDVSAEAVHEQGANQVVLERQGELERAWSGRRVSLKRPRPS